MPSPALDDEAVEAFLSGRCPAAADLGSLAAFAEDVSVAVSGPAPAPRGALARLLNEGIPAPSSAAWARPAPRVPPQPAAPHHRRKHMTIAELLAVLAAKLAGLGMAAKAALGLGVAAASVTGEALTEAGRLRSSRVIAPW
jgi:hypothetical protein